MADTTTGHPLATADQREVELIAIKLMDDPVVKAAAAETAREMKALIPHGAGSAAIFDYEFHQMVFISLLAAINADPNHPRVHSVSLFPHRTDGIAIPGTKALHPSPDYIYRLAPIDGQARYVLRGRKPTVGPLTFEVSLVGEGLTLGNLSLHELMIAADGAFEITIDTSEAGARPNHIQSAATAQQLIIRDIFDHIAVQRPIELSIERLDQPARPPLTNAEIIATVRAAMQKSVVGVMAVTRAIKGEANILPPPAFMNQGETLVTQAYSMGHFRLSDDEGFLVNLTLGKSGYAIVPATNYWGGIGDFLNHRTCVSTGRAAANPDGSFTFVVSKRDPGVANWVDTDGLDEGTLCVRWAAFSRDAGPMPTLEAKPIRLADLEAHLPHGVPRCDPAARREQLAAHARDYTAWEAL